LEERVLVLVGLLALVVLAALAVRVAVSHRASAAIGMLAPAGLRSRVQAGRPSLVYFFGPGCPTCADQSTVLEAIAADTRIAILKVDASAEPALASALGAVSVPTTALLDPTGRVHKVNVGYHPREILTKQLAAMSPALYK
jgi:thiol-disulfide isomerase/thioredoxin